MNMQCFRAIWPARVRDRALSAQSLRRWHVLRILQDSALCRLSPKPFLLTQLRHAGCRSAAAIELTHQLLRSDVMNVFSVRRPSWVLSALLMLIGAPTYVWGQPATVELDQRVASVLEQNGRRVLSTEQHSTQLAGQAGSTGWNADPVNKRAQRSMYRA